MQYKITFGKVSWDFKNKKLQHTAVYCQGKKKKTAETFLLDKAYNLNTRWR
jgi:hypothetical protein